MKNSIKIICLALVMCLAVCGLTACGAKDVKVTVKDMGATTEIDAKTDMTVMDALAKANITLGEKDETEPEKSSKLKEDAKEIIVKRYAEVTVVNGSEKKQVSLVGGTVADAVKEAGYTVTDEIKPDAPLTDYLKNGMTINMVKGVKVSLTVDGKTTEVTTFMTTVEALLKEQNITLSTDDTVNADLTAKITEGMSITVSRVTYKEETATEKIDYEIEQKTSDSMAEGTSEIAQQGAEGEKTVTYKVKYVDGKEESREKIKEEVTKEPVKQIVTVGTKSSSGSDAGSGSDGGSGSDSGSGSGSGGRTEVSRVDMPDCDGSGHGYYIVTYSDDSTEFVDY